MSGSFSDSLMAFLGGLSACLLVMGSWATIAFADPFMFVFAIAGLAGVSMAVSEIAERPVVFEAGCRASALGGWLWLTVMVADVMNQGDPLLLPHAHITALFGLASGAFMLSAFQSVGWIDGPLVWGDA